jgi:hypothetical protein
MLSRSGFSKFKIEDSRSDFDSSREWIYADNIGAKIEAAITKAI